MKSTKRYWLMKCEPGAYSIDDLARDIKTCWEGVRNYQARNFMRDDMQEGDEALFYHSNADPPGVAGLMTIQKAGYPDFHAFDASNKYFDPKASPGKPMWYMVDVKFVKRFPKYVSLHELKNTPALDGMLVLKKGSRLSIQPVDKKHFEIVKKLGQA